MRRFVHRAGVQPRTRPGGALQDGAVVPPRRPDAHRRRHALLDSDLDVSVPEGTVSFSRMNWFCWFTHQRGSFFG